jgi:hypothetical protein
VTQIDGRTIRHSGDLLDVMLNRKPGNALVISVTVAPRSWSSAYGGQAVTAGAECVRPTAPL